MLNLFTEKVTGVILLFDKKNYYVRPLVTELSSGDQELNGLIIFLWNENNQSLEYNKLMSSTEDNKMIIKVC